MSGGSITSLNLGKENAIKTSVAMEFIIGIALSVETRLIVYIIAVYKRIYDGYFINITQIPFNIKNFENVWFRGFFNQVENFTSFR